MSLDTEGAAKNHSLGKWSKLTEEIRIGHIMI